jgi:hypothetical protein
VGSTPPSRDGSEKGIPELGVSMDIDPK